MSRIIVVTGTDTAVGKTVFTALLARHLQEQGARVVALKPICSGGRDDARALQNAIHDALALDKINPWHFRAPLAPLFAARRERKHVKLREVVAHVRQVAQRFPVVLVEGAGGLLSPLGESFSTRELVSALGADPIVVARNHLGVVNHVRLTLEAMPPPFATRTRVVLMSPKRPDAATRTNARLLGEFMASNRIFALPNLARPNDLSHSLARRNVGRILAAVVAP